MDQQDVLAHPKVNTFISQVGLMSLQVAEFIQHLDSPCSLVRQLHHTQKTIPHAPPIDILVPIIRRKRNPSPREMWTDLTRFCNCPLNETRELPPNTTSSRPPSSTTLDDKCPPRVLQHDYGHEPTLHKTIHSGNPRFRMPLQSPTRMPTSTP